MSCRLLIVPRPLLCVRKERRPARRTIIGPPRRTRLNSDHLAAATLSGGVCATGRALPCGFGAVICSLAAEAVPVFVELELAGYRLRVGVGDFDGGDLPRRERGLDVGRGRPARQGPAPARREDVEQHGGVGGRDSCDFAAHCGSLWSGQAVKRPGVEDETEAGPDATGAELG